jgi:hypothetical protein
MDHKPEQKFFPQEASSICFKTHEGDGTYEWLPVYKKMVTESRRKR